MPGHDIHLFVDRVFFGKEFPLVHRAIDSAIRFTGFQHRKYFHTPFEAIGIARYCYASDPVAVSSALFHLDVDNLCSEDKNFENLLRVMASRDTRKERDEPKVTDLLIQLMENMNKNNRIMANFIVLSSKQQTEFMQQIGKKLLEINKEIGKMKLENQKKQNEEFLKMQEKLFKDSMKSMERFRKNFYKN